MVSTPLSRWIWRSASPTPGRSASLLSGTREGGVFEDPRIVVYEHDPRGQDVRHDVYSVDQLDLARARFAELRDPLHNPPAAAIPAQDQQQ